MLLYCFLFTPRACRFGKCSSARCPQLFHAFPLPAAPPRADQIVSVRTWLNESCGIPESDMVGMRNPFLITNPGIRKVGGLAAVGADTMFCLLLSLGWCLWWRPTAGGWALDGHCIAAVASQAQVTSVHHPHTGLFLHSPQVQSEAGFLYDSSINEHWTKDGMWPTSKDGGNRLWPYTFDNGIPQVCYIVLLALSVKNTPRPGAAVPTPAGRQQQHAHALRHSPCRCAAKPRETNPPCPCRPRLTALQICDATGPDGSCTKDEKYRGLWEVPVWVLQVRIQYP